MDEVTTHDRVVPSLDLCNGRAGAQDISQEEAKQQLALWGLSGHVITAEETAFLVAFLASPKSAAVNGASIGGDGARGSVHY